jgi:formate dehydrogenase maturation protein FdhE
MSFTKEQVSLYLSSDGNTCPFCGSEDITAGESTFQGEDAWQEVMCNACLEEWYEDFKMTGISPKGE